MTDAHTGHAAATPYTPTVSDDEVQRYRQWHENAYRMAKTEAGTGRTFNYHDRTFVVPPEVHPVSPLSHLLGDAVLAEVGDADRVLDMGTGCGIHAILAAAKSHDVTAVDLNPHAVEATRHNAELNGVADRVQARQSDIFAAVDGTFDVIIFDPPFRWFTPRDPLEMASADEGYRGMTTFFRTVKQYLRPGGRMLIFFGTSGDLEYMKRLIDEQGFTREVVAHHEMKGDGFSVDYYTFRLTLP
jgi:release factor glutamine methyltransferase